jgi:hypothetical protein
MEWVARHRLLGMKSGADDRAQYGRRASLRHDLNLLEPCLPRRPVICLDRFGAELCYSVRPGEILACRSAM